MAPLIQKNSCVICAQRKVRCDKLNPCSNCSKSQSECVYRAPAVSQRHRKRPADEDIHSKISEYEGLLRKNNIKFQPLDNSWIPSPLEGKLLSESQTTHTGSSASLKVSIEKPLMLEVLGQSPPPDLQNAQSNAARLWSGLPKEVCSLVPPFHL
jgi:hypothetical protein